MTRAFDFLASFLGIIILSPVYIGIALMVVIDSGLPVLYLQERIGIKGKKFNLFKFRTMKINSDQSGLLTVGTRDTRITKTGYILRKYKLDELPQLFNVLKGEMALVGPRPEVEKYVNLYSEKQRKILDVKPGITDAASIQYINENELLGKSEDPEKTYVDEIMPHKIEINLKFIEDRNFFKNIGIILKTIFSILR